MSDKKVIIWSPKYKGAEVVDFLNSCGFVEDMDFKFGSYRKAVYILPLKPLYRQSDSTEYKFQTIALRKFKKLIDKPII